MKTNGPGKYDGACSVARNMTQAVACLLIVVEGNQGNGFSVQSLEPDLIPHLPALLREVARGIEAGFSNDADS